MSSTINSKAKNHQGFGLFQGGSSNKQGDEIKSSHFKKKTLKKNVSAKIGKKHTVHLKGELCLFSMWSHDKAHFMHYKETKHKSRKTSKVSVSGSETCIKSLKTTHEWSIKHHRLYIYICKLENNAIMWQLHLPYNIQNATYLKVKLVKLIFSFF